jgi:hypothetical protein
MKLLIGRSLRPPRLLQNAHPQAAKAVGLDRSPALRARADEAIE